MINLKINFQTIQLVADLDKKFNRNVKFIKLGNSDKAVINPYQCNSKYFCLKPSSVTVINFPKK